MGILSLIRESCQNTRLVWLVYKYLHKLDPESFHWMANQLSSQSRHAIEQLPPTMPDRPQQFIEDYIADTSKLRNCMLALWDFFTVTPTVHDENKQQSLCKIVLLIGIGGCRLDSDQILEMENSLKFFSREEVRSLFAWDPLISNLLLNIWEYVHAVAELDSYPWNISLPVADICNARCTFCTSWLEGRKVLPIEKLESFSPVLKHAIYVGLVGHGEPLAHPHFSELCGVLKKFLDVRSTCYTITNGVFLKKWKNELDAIHIDSYSISLNAATPKTHNEIMGLGIDAFSDITHSIGQLVGTPSSNGSPRQVYITMVITRQNLEEIPAFIQLGNDLGVSGIWLRTLLPQSHLIPGLNYHLLPPNLHPAFEELRANAIDAIQNSQVKIQANPEIWGNSIFSPLIQKGIQDNPPPTLIREDVIKSQEIRNRTKVFYEPSETLFKGRLKQGSNNTTVEWVHGAIRITTPCPQWAYAVSIPVKFPKQMGNDLEIEVILSETKGTVGVGLLDCSTNEWIDRKFVAEGSHCTLALRCPPKCIEIWLVLENAQENGMSSQTTLHAARFRQSNEVENQANLPSINLEEIDFGKPIIHNPIDPLEDGLNPLNRQARFPCKAVYYNLYINELFFRLSPCCYMTEVPGFEEIRFDGQYEFLEAWNSPAMMKLRDRLNHGPLFGSCQRCPENW